MPFSHLYILHADVEHLTLTHLSSIDTMSVVRLPYIASSGQTLFKSSLLQAYFEFLLLTRSLSTSSPASVVASPPILVHTLDLTFRGVHSMANMLGNVPFPVLHTLCLQFSVDDDLTLGVRLS
jgi:hypothetical protein